MIWCALAVIGWIGIGVTLAINIHNNKTYKETRKEHNELQEKYKTLSKSYAIEVDARWRCENDWVDVQEKHKEELSFLRGEIERIKLKYEHQLNKHIELMEKIIWVDENERGDTK